MNIRTLPATLVVLTCFLTLVSRATGQQNQTHKNQQTPLSRPRPSDFSTLDPLKNALLELKGAVSVGVSYQDYLRKLQSAAGEQLKSEDRIRDVQRRVAYRLSCYKLTLLYYRNALSSWDHLMFMRDPKYSDNPGIDDRIAEAEEQLQKDWQDASDQLDQCNLEKPTTPIP